MFSEFRLARRSEGGANVEEGYPPGPGNLKPHDFNANQQHADCDDPQSKSRLFRRRNINLLKSFHSAGKGRGAGKRMSTLLSLLWSCGHAADYGLVGSTFRPGPWL
jgi:hypothetical protein